MQDTQPCKHTTLTYRKPQQQVVERILATVTSVSCCAVANLCLDQKPWMAGYIISNHVLGVTPPLMYLPNRSRLAYIDIVRNPCCEISPAEDFYGSTLLVIHIAGHRLY